MSGQAPWNYRCPHCGWYIVVNNRGAHGGDPGAGVQAWNVMQNHIAAQHPEHVKAPSVAGTDTA